MRKLIVEAEVSIDGAMGGEHADSWKQPRIFEHMGINTLKLLDTTTFGSGVVALRYQPQS